MSEIIKRCAVIIVSRVRYFIELLCTYMYINRCDDSVFWSITFFFGGGGGGAINIQVYFYSRISFIPRATKMVVLRCRRHNIIIVLINLKPFIRWYILPTVVFFLRCSVRMKRWESSCVRILEIVTFFG